MWKNYFCSLLNSVPINSHQESANKSATKNGNFNNIHEFQCDRGTIRLLLFELPLNRACRNNNIFAEHIHYAHESIFFHLSVFVMLVLFMVTFQKVYLPLLLFLC